jgi:hypothetical protein
MEHSKQVVTEMERVTSAVKLFKNSSMTEQDYYNLLVDGFVALTRIHPSLVKDAVSKAFE